MALPILVAVTFGLVWLLSVGTSELRTVDAAREAARAAARGDPADGQQVGPPGTRIAVTDDGSEVVATATAQVQGPGGLFGWLPSVDLTARATAAKEVP